MDLADQAESADGRQSKMRLYGLACDHETTAASKANGIEPSSSAMNAGQPARGLRLAALGLEGNPPNEIKLELLAAAKEAMRSLGVAKL